jgi:hypothetical protein
VAVSGSSIACSVKFRALLSQIGPYHNPQETYKYYTLPFCRPELKLTPAKKWAGWSEVFEGSEFLNSDLAIPFGRRWRMCPWIMVVAWVCYCFVRANLRRKRAGDCGLLRYTGAGIRRVLCVCGEACLVCCGHPWSPFWIEL